MIIVCDTNVFISALVLLGGNPDKIVRACMSGRFQNATSPDLLAEFKRVLMLKFNYTTKEAQEMITMVTHFSMLVDPNKRLTVVKADDADNRVIECAITAKARYIVTGDKTHLLPLKRVDEIDIISPADFVLNEGII